MKPVVVGTLAGAVLGVLLQPQFAPRPLAPEPNPAAPVGALGGHARHLFTERAGAGPCDTGLEEIQTGWFEGVCVTPADAARHAAEHRSAQLRGFIVLASFALAGGVAGYAFQRTRRNG